MFQWSDLHKINQESRLCVFEMSSEMIPTQSSHQETARLTQVALFKIHFVVFRVYDSPFPDVLFKLTRCICSNHS